MNYTQKKYVFKIPFVVDEGTIPEGSEIIVFRDVIYLNGGMIHPAYQELLRKIVDTPSLNEKYLKELRIIQNKI
jgi:hypothetical protein